MSEIVLATTTLYKNWYPGVLRDIADIDKVRGDLALLTIRSAVDSGYRVVVVDRLSPPEFVTELTKTKVLIEKEPKSKRSPGRRRAFALAASLPDVKAIIWTEAEKAPLVRFFPVISQPIIEGEADLVVPKRDPFFFKSFYPKYMYESEIIANRLGNNFLRKHGLRSKTDPDLDLFFGPRVFSMKSINFAFEKYNSNYPNITVRNEYADPEEFLNTIYFPIASALYQKKKVASITIPFKYPETQRQNEETDNEDNIKKFKEHRRKQREGILLGLFELVKYLEGKNSLITRE